MRPRSGFGSASLCLFLSCESVFGFAARIEDNVSRRDGQTQDGALGCMIHGVSCVPQYSNARGFKDNAIGCSVVRIAGKESFRDGSGTKRQSGDSDWRE